MAQKIIWKNFKSNSKLDKFTLLQSHNTNIIRTELLTQNNKFYKFNTAPS
jgi:hypothetical protein